MKTIMTISTIAIFTLIGCGSDSSSPKVEENNTTKNPSNNNTTTKQCMDFVSLDKYFNSIVYVDFIDDNNGWVIGYNKTLGTHVLLNTSDQGTTWNIINKNLELNYGNGIIKGESLKFVTATNGFKLVRDKPNDTILKLQYTTDKGKTWTALKNPFTDFQNKALSIDNWMKYFTSNSKETLFYGHSYRNLLALKVDNQTMKISLFQKISDDASITANVKSTIVGETYPAFSVSIEANAGGGFHLAEDGTITSVVNAPIKDSFDTVSQMAQSTDNGETWKIMHSMKLTYLKTTSWATDNAGYISGYDGNRNSYIYKTLDGGETWSEKEAKEFQMMRFANSDNGIAVTDFDFYTTSNAGKTWQEIECKSADGQALGGFDEVLSYPSVGNGWIAGGKYSSDRLNRELGLYHYVK